MWISLQVALWATLLAAGPGLGLGWLLARRRFRGRAVLDGLVQMPVILPAVAIGYGLLWTLGDQGLGLAPQILFTRKAAILASALMATPLIARLAQVAIEAVDPRLESMARSLGMGSMEVLWRVTLPLSKRGLAAALVLGFGRALGEFGATVIVAGLVPGETRTLALGIFEEIQLGHQSEAMGLVGLAAAVGFGAAVLASRLGQVDERV